MSLRTGNPTERPVAYNLRRDGWQACAARAEDVIRSGRGSYTVYVFDTGRMQVLPAHKSCGTAVTEFDIVGTYNKQAPIEVIEGDLIERVRELCAADGVTFPP